LSVGSRGVEFINYKDACTLSGVDKNKAIQVFDKSMSLIIRQDLINFCFEFMSYKFSLTQQGDLVLNWSVDEWKYPNDKVSRNNLRQDFTSVVNVLKDFNKNFEMSDAKKINY